jgi:hypothetical protein
MIRAATVLFLSLSLAAAMASAASSGGSCQRVPLPSDLQWVSSATYVPALNQLLFLNTAKNQIVKVDPATGRTAADEALMSRVNEPAMIAPAGSGFLLKQVGPTGVTLDSQLNVQSQARWRAMATATLPVAGPFYQMTVAGNSIVAYGSIRTENDYTLGFIRLPANDVNARPEMLMPFPANRFYALGYQYVTSLGPTAYFITMDRTAELYKVPAGQRPILLPNAIPAEYRDVSAIRTVNGADQSADLYRELKEKTIPVSLTGGPDGYLYLVTRKPGVGGQTSWSIFRLTADGVVLGMGHLATDAKHLTVVPSPSTWYFIERGDVDGAVHQKVESLLKVPSGRLTGLVNGEVCP